MPSVLQLEVASPAQISMMRSDSQVVGIVATAKLLGNKSNQLLAVHTLSPLWDVIWSVICLAKEKCLLDYQS